MFGIQCCMHGENKMVYHVTRNEIQRDMSPSDMEIDLRLKMI